MTCHVIVLPFSEHANQDVSSKLFVENLREEVEVADKGGLEDDGDVRGIEKLDLVGLGITLHLSAGNGEFDSESL